MTALDREQLKRDYSDALHAIQHDNGVDGIPALVASLADTWERGETRTHTQASYESSKEHTATACGHIEPTVSWSATHF